MSDVTLTALLSGPDMRGIVAKVAGWIYERGGNIIHADQHRDQEEEIFFQRVEWSNGDSVDLESVGRDFERFAESLGMKARVVLSTHRPKIAVFVSRFDHCFHDLVLRWKAGEFSCEVACVLSNHRVVEETCAQYGIPFHFTPVTAGTREEDETRQIEILSRYQVELIVLARYMQILSERFLREVKCPVINIHHSFLPAFAGGSPYHQAYARGVKLIGATAHFATPVLDDGPIIQQDVARVTHRHNVGALVRKGRNLEKMVLAQAVMGYLENRILIYGRKTVVFD